MFEVSDKAGVMLFHATLTSMQCRPQPGCIQFRSEFAGDSCSSV